MPFKRLQYIDEISYKLAQLRLELTDHNKMGLYNDNLMAENFFCGFLNILKGWNLKNANDAKKNFPGADLIDEENRIAVQVSSTATSGKIQHSLGELIAHTDDSDEYQFYMLVTTEKQKHYQKDFNLGDRIAFDKATDIWDVSDLLNQIKRCETTMQTLEKLYQYLEEELGFIDKESLIKNHFLHKGENVDDIMEYGSQKEKYEWSPGDFFNFGSCTQTADGRSEAILWRVLDVNEENGQILLISDKALAAAPYNNEYRETNWAECSLRKWLNDDFMQAAFTKDEIENIIPVKNKTKGSAVTYDSVFLLSSGELEAYLELKDRIPRDMVTNIAGFGWLRDTISDGRRAMGVHPDGSFRESGYKVTNAEGLVRPALWVNMAAL